MEVGSRETTSGSGGRPASRRRRFDLFPHLRAPPAPPAQLFPTNPARQEGDRFIPYRSATNFDVFHCPLTEPKKEVDHTTVVSPMQEAYQKCLADCCLPGGDRIFRFKPKPFISSQSIIQEACTADNVSSRRKIRRIPQSPVKIFYTPHLVDDYSLNLLDWGNGNWLALALGNMVYLFDFTNGMICKLTTVDDYRGPITSVSWADDGHRLAIGLNNSDVELWDTNSASLLRTLRGAHRYRVGSLAWNNSMLTTGGMDGKIVNNDVRMRSHILSTYIGHRHEVCSLKWSGSGKWLASGGTDKRLHIWDLYNTQSQRQWAFRFEDHTSAVKGLAWCPFQSNLLASGGGFHDRCIKFWDINTGVCLNSVDTGSQVCALLWNKNEKELLSSHGFTKNQLILWRYPSMVRMADLEGHDSRVLFMAQSPDGCTVASAEGNGTLLLWNVFGDPKAPKPAKSTKVSPFSSFSYIR